MLWSLNLTHFLHHCCVIMLDATLTRTLCVCVCVSYSFRERNWSSTRVSWNDSSSVSGVSSHFRHFPSQLSPVVLKEMLKHRQQKIAIQSSPETLKHLHLVCMYKYIHIGRFDYIYRSLFTIILHSFLLYRCSSARLFASSALSL